MQKTFFLLILSMLFFTKVFGQTKCFSENDRTNIITSVSNPQNVELNRKLRIRLLLMKRELENRLRQQNPSIFHVDKKNDVFTQNLCEIYKKYGWLTKYSVGQQGVEAAQFLIRNSYPKSVRLEFLPILNAAAKKSLIQKSEFAKFADAVNVEFGFPQMFGTQADTTGNIVYLYPLFDKNKVDKWRRKYNLPPLNDFLQYLETKYRTIVVKKPLPAAAYNFKNNIDISDHGKPKLNLSDDVLNIDTKLINLNVRLLNKQGLPAKELKLTKGDFEVYEDNKRQVVSFLSSSSNAFDLILLLDLSGSTKGKRDIIWKAVKRFVKATRRTDRVAIVTHRPNLVVLVEPTYKKSGVVKKARKFKNFGGSNIWDALYLTHEQLIKQKSRGRRAAIVHMTDGEEIGSRIAFGTLLESVRDWDTTIFSIHLATSTNKESLTYRKAHNTLELLATETGGQYYKVTKVQDLSGVYEKIAKDLSQVYSLGYETTNENQRGTFRRLIVRIRNRPEIIVRTKSGYYAK